MRRVTVIVYGTFEVPGAGVIFGTESREEVLACEQEIIDESINMLLRRGVEYDFYVSRAHGHQTTQVKVEFTFSRPL